MNKVIYSIITLFLVACSPENNSEQKVKKTIILNESVSNNLSNSVSKMAKQHFGAIEPIKQENLNQNLVKLGQVLYHDKRLSKDGNISCNSCHNLETYGVDNLPTSPGDERKNGDRNSPTVLNAGDHIAQFWDGRAASIEDQAGMPILNPVEMNIPNEQFLIDRLKEIELYQKLFSKAFPKVATPITYMNLKNAIGAFERTLVTPSRFDEFLNGNIDVLASEEMEGIALFVKTGCASCHNGKLLGANSYQKFGVTADYWTYTKSELRDEGRFNLTNNSADKYYFKVPGLRNIGKTFPYFHDGSVQKLSDAVWIMAKVQLDKELSEDEVSLIVKFLESTNGNLPAATKSLPAELAQKS